MVYVVPEYIPPGAVVEEEGEPTADMDDQDMGIGAPFEMRHGNLRIVHMGAAPGVGKGEIAGTAAQVAFLKAWKAHPPGYSAAELAGLLQAAADYGTKINASRPFQFFPDYNPGPLNQATTKASDAANLWRTRMPWFGATTYYAKTGPEAQAVYKTITGLYQEASGITGASETVRAAQAELIKDLTSPDRWAWWQKIKPYAIIGAVLVGGAVAYPYVKPLLSRASRSE